MPKYLLCVCLLPNSMEWYGRNYHFNTKKNKTKQNIYPFQVFSYDGHKTFTFFFFLLLLLLLQWMMTYDFCRDNKDKIFFFFWKFEIICTIHAFVLCWMNVICLGNQKEKLKEIFYLFFSVKMSKNIQFFLHFITGGFLFLDMVWWALILGIFFFWRKMKKINNYLERHSNDPIIVHHQCSFQSDRWCSLIVMRKNLTDKKNECFLFWKQTNKKISGIPRWTIRE